MWPPSCNHCMEVYVHEQKSTFCKSQKFRDWRKNIPSGSYVSNIIIYLITKQQFSLNCISSVQSKNLNQNEKYEARPSNITACLVLLRLEAKKMKRKEAKRYKIRSRTKRNYREFCFASLRSEKVWSETKRKKRNFSIFLEAKEAKHMRNTSCFASFRFEAKFFFRRNRRTLVCPPPPIKLKTNRSYRLVYICIRSFTYQSNMPWSPV
jgi:hypothetical protein